MPPDDFNDALEKIGEAIESLATATTKQAEANLKTAETFASLLQGQLLSVTTKIDSLAETMRRGFEILRDGQAQRNVRFSEVDGRIQSVDQRVSNMNEQTRAELSGQRVMNEKVWKILDDLRADRNKLWAGLIILPVVLQVSLFLINLKWGH